VEDGLHPLQRQVSDLLKDPKAPIMGNPSRCPLARIAAIDRAIRGGGWPNASTLARELEVSPRTVQRDIIFLRDRLQAPLEFDGHRHGYCYTREDFRLPFFQLSEGELVGLFLAERLLQQYRGTYFEIQFPVSHSTGWKPVPRTYQRIWPHKEPPGLLQAGFSRGRIRFFPKLAGYWPAETAN
jgi:hypothetical protein